MSVDHELVTAREDWERLAAKDEAIDRSHQGYRDDPEAARNLEATAWPPERVEATLRGEVLIVDRASVPQRGPVIDLNALAGRQVVRPPMSPWAEFVGLHAQVNNERTELLARIHPEVTEAAAAREREILAGVGAMRVDDLDRPAAELTSLVRTLAACRAAAGVRPRQGQLREVVTATDVFLAAAAMAAGQPFSLLTPVTQEQRSMIVGSQGLGQDAAPIPRKATTLPPAGVIFPGG